MLNYTGYFNDRMNILGIIPARYSSSRFPGKPLAMIGEKSMICRVYEQALKCKSLSGVIIATDHKAIEDHVREFGGNVMMTSPDHSSGTERCREVLERLTIVQKDFYDGVINIQGDEPFIDPIQIGEVAECLSRPGVQIATLVKKFVSNEESDNPNVVKVVFDNQFRALYFSRSPIPYFRGNGIGDFPDQQVCFKHIGIYGYRVSILFKLCELPVSPLEKAESLEQLRWLENGYPVHVRETELETMAIDTPSDLLKITNRP